MTKPLFAAKAVSAIKEHPVKSAFAADNSISFTKSAVVPQKVGTSLAKSPSIGIDIRNPNEVSKYGANSQEKVAKFADEILACVKTSASAEVGGKMVEIVSIAKGLNVSDLNGTASKVPLIGGLLDRLASRRDRFAAKFNSLKQQIEKVVTEIDTVSANLSKRNEVLEQLYAHNMQEYHELDKLISEGKAFTADQRQQFIAQIEEAKAQGLLADPMVAQNYNDWKQSIDNFEKRNSDLEAVQMMATQTMPEIRLIQNGNKMLIEKFNNVKTLTIPAWKKQFVLAVTLDEQKKGADLAQTVDDATNDFYKAQADLLGKNVISIAKTNQRSIIDLDSLQHMQNTLITSFEELSNIEAEGEARRKAMSTTMGEMKKELYEKLVVQK